MEIFEIDFPDDDWDVLMVPAPAPRLNPDRRFDNLRAAPPIMIVELCQALFAADYGGYRKHQIA
jgi:hypothetical protein